MADQPGYTRMPNALLELLSLLPDAECRVMLVIARKTIGWQKVCDVISYSQLEAATGMAHQGVINGVKAAVKRGILKREPSGHNNGFCYEILVDQVVHEVDHLAAQVVHEVDTQKKDLKEKEIKRESVRHSPRTPKQKGFESLSESVVTYKELTGKKQVTPAVATLIADRVTDNTYWRSVVTNWCSFFRADNVNGMLDWYDHPEKMAAKMGYSNGLGNNQTQSGRLVQRNGHRPANADLPSRPVSNGQAEYERQYREWLNSDDEAEFTFQGPHV